MKEKELDLEAVKKFTRNLPEWITPAPAIEEIVKKLITEVERLREVKKVTDALNGAMKKIYEDQIKELNEENAKLQEEVEIFEERDDLFTEQLIIRKLNKRVKEAESELDKWRNYESQN
ncbi:hypothetical protein IIC44_02825 [Patescibacteria group bacterium]|nr:hypothetical protein [Patescibacteria group bacterium]